MTPSAMPKQQGLATDARPSGRRRTIGSSSIYDLFQRTGAIFVFATIALSLVVDLGGVGLIAAFLLISIVASAGKSITSSIRKFDRSYRNSDAGKVYILFVIYFLVSLLLTFYHSENLGEIETAAKQLIIGYTIFFYLRKYDIGVVFLAVAVGALLACVAGVYQSYFLDIDRAAGVTNPIRFGFAAGLFGSLSLVGFLFYRRSRPFAILTLAGALAGLVGTYLSGSMGAAIAVPPMLAMILARSWNTSKTSTVSVCLAFVVMLIALVSFDAGSMKSRTLSAVDSVYAWSEGDIVLNDESLRLRTKILNISGDLFLENPLLGAGKSGWVEAIANAAKTDVNSGFEVLNQAHNQLADDLAKGGIVRGLLGLNLLLLPLFLFLRFKPFSDTSGSVPALAAVVTCVGFIGISLTESVMILSLPASLYAVLICFFTAAQQNCRNNS